MNCKVQQLIQNEKTLDTGPYQISILLVWNPTGIEPRMMLNAKSRSPSGQGQLSNRDVQIARLTEE